MKYFILTAFIFITFMCNFTQMTADPFMGYTADQIKKDLFGKSVLIEEDLLWTFQNNETLNVVIESVGYEPKSKTYKLIVWFQTWSNLNNKNNRLLYIDGYLKMEYKNKNLHLVYSFQPENTDYFIKDVSSLDIKIINDLNEVWFNLISNISFGRQENVKSLFNIPGRQFENYKEFDRRYNLIFTKEHILNLREAYPSYKNIITKQFNKFMDVHLPLQLIYSKMSQVLINANNYKIEDIRIDAEEPKNPVRSAWR